MSMDDLSYLQALMGMTASEEAAGGATGGAGGVWVVDPDNVAAAAAYGAADDAVLRLVGKARVVADALGGYVYLLACGSPTEDAAQRAIHAGADNVLTATGTPALADLIAFFRERGPQAVLFPRTRAGRTLGPGLAQALGGGLCGYAADLAVDPMSQRILAHQPVLDDAARQVVAILAAPAVVVVDTAALPAAFNEPWRSGSVEDTGLAWPTPPEYPAAELPAAPLTIKNAPVIVAAGLGLTDAAGFALAGKLAEALGGVVAGDLGALDAGWITEDQLVGLTGASVAPKLYLALGIDGDTSQFMATQEAGMIVAVQPDPAAPFVSVADYNIIADPAEFAGALLEVLGK
jgi:electron transfer flavoprotein alpha subunit